MDQRFGHSYRSARNDIPSESESSNSDSGDEGWKRKKSRKRVASVSPVKQEDTKPLPPVEDEASCSVKKKKPNNIWNNVLEEQTMSENLTQFGLKSKPVSYQDRSCESYDYTLSASYQRNEKTADIGDFDDTSDIKLDNRSNENSHENRAQHRHPKSSRESRDVLDKVARKIIRVLNERKHHIIFKAVEVLGSKKALELLKETEKIEDSGGMLVMDNSRRRTPGGTFLQLLKKDPTISGKKKAMILSEDRRKQMKHSRHKKKKNNPVPMEIISDTPCKGDEESANEDELFGGDDDELLGGDDDELLGGGDDDELLGGDDKGTIQQNGIANGTNQTVFQNVERSVHVEDPSSELEEGEVPD